MNLYEELTWRGLIKDVTDEELFKSLLAEKATVYAGFDPTANSLHIGHLVPVLMLKRFQQHGHRIIALVGGGTGLIGDPSGRKSERQMLTLEQSLQNAQGIKHQLSRFLDFSDAKKTIMVNNYEWLHQINIIDYLRDVGKNFPINYMLSKDVVASRMEAGITYTEFSYMILQSLDFWNLYQKEHCRIQIGGSDQWGNITAGVELIRRIGGDAKVAGITLPLITKSDGTKFGKSAGGAIWLDADLSSAYSIYQYFLNTADEDVIHYLKVFTFVTMEEINSLEQEVIAHPEERKAQKVLAYELVKVIHGSESADEAIHMSEVLFGGNVKELSAKQLEVCLNGVSSVTMCQGSNLVDALIAVGAASSKREAREFLGKGTYTINGDKVSDTSFVLTKEVAVEGRLVVIRRGKKNYYLVVLQ